MTINNAVTLDRGRIGHHIAKMRPYLVLLATLTLAACSGDPRSLGITGPGTAPAPTASAEPAGMDATPSPGAPTTGTYYGPTNHPVTGASGFWGYNN